MEIIMTLEALYEAYLTTMQQLEERHRNVRSALSGIFGVGPRPDTDPCNDRFATGVKNSLLQFSQTRPAPDEAAAAMRYVLEQGKLRTDTGRAALMLEAVHGYTIVLVEYLSPEAAAQICAWYEKAYPRHTMFPAQKQLWKALKAQK